MSSSTKYPALLMSIICVFVACTQQPDKIAEKPNENRTSNYLDTVKMPPPIVAKYIDPDSIAPPRVVPLKGRPKVTPAHSNVHPAGAGTVVQILKDLEVITLGKNGVPLPKTIPAERKVVPAKHPKPIPAEDFRTKDAAIYDIQFLSDEQGLESPYVVAILEDSRGHLWFGTIGGSAFRYDGQNFFKYTTEEGLLVHHGLASIMEDSKGNIWFGGEGGVCYYDGQNFVQFTIAERPLPEGLEGIRAGAFMEDSKGNIWFQSKDLYCYDGENFTVYDMELSIGNKAKKLRKDWFTDGSILEIMEDSRGHIWLATFGIGVMRFDGQHIVHLTEEDGLVGNHISEILEDREGNIWFASGGIGVTGKGVSRFTPDLSMPYGVGGTFTNFNKEDGLSGNRYQEILQDDAGDIWFATYDGGICSYDGKNFTHFTKEEGMSFNSVLSLMRDSKANLWAGTNGGGISKFKPRSFRHFTENQGLGKHPIGAIMEDHQGNIWMGQWYSGVQKYDGQHFTNYTKENGLLHDFTNGLMEDRHGNIWFIYRNDGVSKFDGKTFTHYTTAQGLGHSFFWNSLEDSQGMIWFANGWQGGINRLDPVSGNITHFVGDEKECIGCGSIFEDSQGDLWFCGRDHVAKFNKEQDQIDFVCQVDTLENDYLDYMIEDEAGNVWFGGQRSIAQVKQNGAVLKDHFPRYTTGKELPNILINSAVYDQQGNLWVGSDLSGLTVFIDGMKNIGQPDFKWLQYGKADGLKSKHSSFNSSLLDSKNRMWWGHPNSLTMLDLNNFQIPTEAPENHGLSHIEIQQEYIDYGSLSDTSYRSTLAFGKPLSESFDSIVAFKNYPAKLTLPYHLNHLTFHFEAIDWNAPHQIQYSFKINGIDNDWSHPSSEAKADYRNLPNGTFTFEVKAIGEAKIWSEPFAYTVTIRPPWWQTWWAYGMYVLLAVGIVGGYVLRLRRKIKEKQEQLVREQYLNRELRELNIATTRFVPRDFVHILNKDNLKELKLGDQTQANMTVLFADIRDYTGLSESMTPDENFRFINAYLGRMGPIIQEHGGFICQYYGDGIMALFKDNHDLAVKAAIEMQQALQRYNRKRFAHNRQPIQVGIGLNTGQLMLGVIGDEQRYDTSVISDVVNTASRMEGLTKIFGCQVIASEKTLMELDIKTDTPGKDTLGGDYRFLGMVKVKGKDRVLKIYDFYDGETEEIRRLKSSTKTLFEKALQLYHDRQFGKAADVFKIVLEKYPSDVATHYYMDKSVKYIVDGVEESWSGVEEMMIK